MQIIKVIARLFCIVFVLVCSQTVVANVNSSKKSVILFIGDGMGYPHVSLARAYNSVVNQNPNLMMDPLMIGSSGTRANPNETEHISGLVTDSAAAATALGSGHRTYNGAIGLSFEKEVRPVASFLSAAHDAGKATGMVTTSRITHATPAAFIAHVRDRHDETVIAEQYPQSGINVIFGGGECQFVADAKTSVYNNACRDDHKNLKQTLKQNGYEIVYNYDELIKSKNNKVIGLFASSEIPFVKDRSHEIPNLLTQTQQAVRLLENSPEGFVLVVEGGRIDHAAHHNDPASMVQELLEFDSVIGWAKNYVESHPNVSIVATADHETGGLTLGHNEVYDYYPQVLQKVVHSTEFLEGILDKAKTDAEFTAIMRQYAGITDLKPAELKLFHDRSREQAFNGIISARAGLGWTTSGHTGVDVPLIAFGDIKHLFNGRTNNIQIATNIAQYIGVDLDAASKKLQQTYLYPNYRMSIDSKVALSRKECAVLLGQNLDQFKNDFISVEELQKVIQQPTRWETTTRRLIIGSEGKLL